MAYLEDDLGSPEYPWFNPDDDDYLEAAAADMLEDGPAYQPSPFGRRESDSSFGSLSARSFNLSGRQVFHNPLRETDFGDAPASKQSSLCRSSESAAKAAPPPPSPTKGKGLFGFSSAAPSGPAVVSHSLQGSAPPMARGPPGPAHGPATAPPGQQRRASAAPWNFMLPKTLGSFDFRQPGRRVLTMRPFKRILPAPNGEYEISDVVLVLCTDICFLAMADVGDRTLILLHTPHPRTALRIQRPPPMYGLTAFHLSFAETNVFLLKAESVPELRFWVQRLTQYRSAVSRASSHTSLVSSTASLSSASSGFSAGSIAAAGQPVAPGPASSAAVSKLADGLRAASLRPRVELDDEAVALDME